MRQTYVTFNIRKEFVAFWRDKEKIWVYLPQRIFGQKRIEIDVGQWENIRATYERHENDLDQYEDIVNAAWHFLSLDNLIDRNAVQVSDMEVGKYYPRVWRGRYSLHDGIPYNPIDSRKVYGGEYFQSIVASTSLFEYLNELFKIIEPSKKNYESFGHKIREILMLCCMEIETSWRRIIEENSTNRKERYSTSDYIKLQKLLRLKDWKVVLKDYPDLDIFSPFSEWTVEQPTKSIRWYDAYNAVKHHREFEFEKANLVNLLNAMAGLHIMQAAQWGPELYSILHENRLSPFGLVEHPEYEAKEIYVPQIDSCAHFEKNPYFSI